MNFKQRFKKDPINPYTTLEDYGKQANFKNKKYDNDENQIIKPIWLDTVLKEYETFASKDFTFLKNKIVEYHKNWWWNRCWA